ncbi:IS1595 family transposase [Campylobacter sp. CCUG 57310]|uniref:IS1595 family transposase n=1 Tax=Campylobacter sp. CCUG 57310 TaxID=2517362 RepID=UPI0015652F67|nr:IS1595 family transposase [Campylobacter sp. CCUG 57310]QKF91590.1 transposase, IS1595 family (InsA domain) [Campylobacter sp. CCUG 57310]
MSIRTTELDIIKQLFDNLNEKDRKDFIKSIKQHSKKPKNIATTHKANHCPHCNSLSFVKNGKKNNSQRYICRDCGKTFTDTNKTILFSSKKDISVWQKYIYCMIEKYSLHKTAEICDICVDTAFNWRHKILDALQKMQDEVRLDGVVEADETFTPLSFKGHHKNFNLPRLAKHRGTRASLRGLSKEQVCVTSGINLNGLSIAKISNLGKPKLTDLQKVLDKKIVSDSVLVTDSFRAYLKLAKDMNLSHIRIPRNHYKAGAFNIQVVNSYHSRLKSMLIYNFKGVSTKYLNNYLVYHNFVNFAKESRNDKEIILLDFIQKTECISLVRSISGRPNIPLT